MFKIIKEIFLYLQIFKFLPKNEGYYVFFKAAGNEFMQK